MCFLGSLYSLSAGQFETYREIPRSPGNSCCGIQLHTTTRLSNDRIAYLIEVARSLNKQAIHQKVGVTRFIIEPNFLALGSFSWTAKRGGIMIIGEECLTGSEVNFISILYHEYAHIYFMAVPLYVEINQRYFDELFPVEQAYFKEDAFLHNEMGHPTVSSSELFASAMTLASLVNDGLLDGNYINPPAGAVPYWKWINTLPLFKVSHRPSLFH